MSSIIDFKATSVSQEPPHGYSQKIVPLHPESVGTEKLQGKCCTAAKVKRIALYILASLAILAGCAIIGLSGAGIVTWPLAFLALPLFGGAAALIVVALRIKDYEDPVELQKWRDQAVGLTFSQLVKSHGLENIRKYNIVSLVSLQQKFGEENRYKKFMNLVEDHSLEKIRMYDLMPVEKLRSLLFRDLQCVNINQFSESFHLPDLIRFELINRREAADLSPLLTQLDAQNKDWEIRNREIDAKYPNRQERLLDLLNKREKDAQQRAARNTESVRSVGSAATNLALAFQKSDPEKGFLGNLSDRLRTKAQGDAITELATIPAGFIFQSQLKQELEQISFERNRILAMEIGVVDQKAYDQEITHAKQIFDSAVAGLNSQFNAITSDSLFLERSDIRLK